MNRKGDAQTDLAALRRAVYERDAPPDAAEAYAAALAALGRIAGPAEEAVRQPGPLLEAGPDAPHHRHHRWAAVGAASGVAATLVLGAVLAGRTTSAPPVPRASVTALAPAPAAVPVRTSTPLPNIAPPPVPGPVLASFTSTRGEVGARLDAGGRQVLLTAVCGGDGTVSIRLSDGTNTILTCSPGQDGLSMAQSTEPLGRFTVTTTTTGHPLWALTIGVVLSAAE